MHRVTQATGKVDHPTGDFVVATFGIQDDWASIAKAIRYFLNIIKPNRLDGIGLTLHRSPKSAHGRTALGLTRS